VRLESNVPPRAFSVTCRRNIDLLTTIDSTSANRDLADDLIGLVPLRSS